MYQHTLQYCTLSVLGREEGYTVKYIAYNLKKSPPEEAKVFTLVKLGNVEKT